MVRLLEKDLRNSPIQSSKGNQLKWEEDGTWYKADHIGYEGLAEYMVSSLLKYSDMDENEYIMYQTEKIEYKSSTYCGCKSRNFLPKGYQLITLERLFGSFYGGSLYRNIFKIQGVKERALFLTEQVEKMTGLKEFGRYLCRMLTVDALFLNEDRHMHNIAVLYDPAGVYHYCPIFDHGSALLSDLTVDYPIGEDSVELIPKAQAKTVSSSFEEQLDAVEELYGQTVSFSFDDRVITRLLDEESYYPEEIKKRVRDILLQQRRKYEYLFK